MSKNLLDMRREYSRNRLKNSGLDKNPFKQFNDWLEDALQADILEPNTFCLSTVSREGFPSSRILLLKKFNEKGFIFFTNYNSRKGKELEGNPHASITFFWNNLERQVHIRGKVEKIPQEESIEYFYRRPIENQIASWISNQGAPLDSRDEIEKKYKQALQEFAKKEVPFPRHWGGYCLKPVVFEFWQGREHRLHDRFLYTWNEALWSIQRLSP